MLPTAGKEGKPFPCAAREVSTGLTRSKSKQHNTTSKQSVAYKVHRDMQLHVACSASPKWNPQNVPVAQVRPNLELSVEDSVRVQLDAIAQNNVPWDNHGIQVMYDFCEGAGSLERSRYFGYSKDLYHFDHFMGGLRTSFPGLFGHQLHRVMSVEPVDPAEATWRVVVQVTSATGVASRVAFTQCRMEYGLFTGCWVTKSLLKEEEDI